MGAIRGAEHGSFAYFPERVGVSPPPTRPVDCVNYSSICSKQLGNYYRHNQINDSRCDVAAAARQNLCTRPKRIREIFFVDFLRLSGTTL